MHTACLERAIGLETDPLANRYGFNTNLVGFMNVVRGGWEYNNRTFAYQVSDD